MLESVIIYSESVWSWVKAQFRKLSLIERWQDQNVIGAMAELQVICDNIPHETRAGFARSHKPASPWSPTRRALRRRWGADDT